MNKMTVNIYGKDYNLISEKSKDFTSKIANFVNDEIYELVQTGAYLSKSDVLVLACNNIAERYFELLENSNMPDENEFKDKISALNREIASLQLQIEQKDIKIQSLEMIDMNSQSLSAKMEKLKSEHQDSIKNLEQQLIEAQNINNELESKFFDLQIKLAKSNEDLKKYESMSKLNQEYDATSSIDEKDDTSLNLEKQDEISTNNADN